MTRPLELLFATAWLALGCGNVDDPPSGAAGSGGAIAVGGSGSFLPPREVDAGPESFGSSPVPCAGTPTPEPAVVRACLLAASCLPEPQELSVSECIAERWPATSGVPACLIAAQSCADVGACFGTTLSAAPCADFSKEALCVGSMRVSCTLPRVTRDCAALGATCTEYVGYPELDPDFVGSADCTVQASCAGATNGTTCQGSKLVHCRDGIAFGEDCAKRGLACADSANGAHCVVNPAGCSEPGTGHCDAQGNGVYCSDELRSIALECSRQGLVCRTAAERAHGVECDAPSCAATEVAQCFEECDGPLAHLCLGGQRFSVDCRSHGLKGCVLEARKDAGDRARCGNE